MLLMTSYLIAIATDCHKNWLTKMCLKNKQTANENGMS